MTNSVKINMTEDDIQELMDRVQRLDMHQNQDVFSWSVKDAEGNPIEVEISVGEDPE